MAAQLPAPVGPRHCQCGPEGHACILRATLRRPGVVYRFTPTGWQERGSRWYDRPDLWRWDL